MLNDKWGDIKKRRPDFLRCLPIFLAPYGAAAPILRRSKGGLPDKLANRLWLSRLHVSGVFANQDRKEPVLHDKDDRVLAAIAHLLGLLTGFLGPLIAYLAKPEEGLGRHQAREALNFQITVAVAYLGSFLLLGFLYFFIPPMALILLGVLFLLLIAVCDYAFCIMGIIRASKGIYYRYPVNIRFVRMPKQVTKK